MELSHFLFGPLSHQLLLPFYKRVTGRRLVVASRYATVALMILSIS